MLAPTGPGLFAFVMRVHRVGNGHPERCGGGFTRALEAILMGGAMGLVAGASACAVVGGGGALPSLPPGVEVIRAERRYEVRGTTTAEILRSLEENGDRALGAGIAGLHETKLEWNYRYGETPGGCEVTDVTIEVNSTITLPEWRDRADAEPEVVEQWETYVARLRTHEDGHRLHAYQAARELSREVGAIEAPSCAALPSTASITGHRVLTKYDEIDAAFDADSANQVWWPPRERR